MNLLSGVTRHVLLIGRYAVKVPSSRAWRCFLAGLQANMQEADFSRLRHPSLCPVLLALPGGWLLVMARAAPLPDAQVKVLRPEDWTGVLAIVEFKPSSFGLLDGHHVAVDYG